MAIFLPRFLSERDHMAIEFVSAMLAHGLTEDQTRGRSEAEVDAILCRRAYRLADALIIEREASERARKVEKAS